jgi:hypothetical protein
MDIYRRNLVLDVPQEILFEYLKHMDVKTSIMFIATCKKTKALDEQFIEEQPKLSVKKTIDGLSSIIEGYFTVLKGMHYHLMHDGLRDDMMSNILRKLIYTSVSNSLHIMGVQSTVVFEQCQIEYNRVFMYFVEQMDISIVEFNNLLEDAQFEYRGYNIININEEKRNQLNQFKQLLKSLYFTGQYTVQATIQYNEVCMEVYYDGEQCVFDIHRHPEGQHEGLLIFLQDFVSVWATTAEGRLKERYDSAQISIVDDQLQWSKDSQEAPSIIAELIIKLMPEQQFYKGGLVSNVEIWNVVMEDNWLLNEVVTETMERYKYEQLLVNASYQIVEDFKST